MNLLQGTTQCIWKQYALARFTRSDVTKPIPKWYSYRSFRLFKRECILKICFIFRTVNFSTIRHDQNWPEDNTFHKDFSKQKRKSQISHLDSTRKTKYMGFCILLYTQYKVCQNASSACSLVSKLLK